MTGPANILSLCSLRAQQCRGKFAKARTATAKGNKMGWNYFRRTESQNESYFYKMFLFMSLLEKFWIKSITTKALSKIFGPSYFVTALFRKTYRLVVWSLYIRLLPKVSDKRIQKLSLNCQSFLCFLFSLSQSFNEYILPCDFSQKHFWYPISSKCQ